MKKAQTFFFHRHQIEFQLFPHLLCALAALSLICSCSEQQSKSNIKQLVYNQATVMAIDREVVSSHADERYGAVLRGLRWCVTFADNDANFDFTFTNYITMLDELTIKDPKSALSRIVHALLLKEFERALPRFPKLFSADVDGYESFIHILPIAYHHQVPIKPFKEFAIRHFAKITPIDRLKEFREAAKDLNYDRLTDLIVDAAFVDMAYRWEANKVLRLPPNNYQTIMREAASIQFVHRYDDDSYHDQNYYATHVLLALNHYGQMSLKPSVIGDKVFFYLTGQYNTVRHQVGDLDLLCEYLYCLKQFALVGVGFINEGERFIISQQRPDGSWGTSDDFEGDPYDCLHPTWTAITLLVQ